MPSDNSRTTMIHDDESLDQRIAAAFAKPAGEGALVPIASSGMTISDAIITAQKVAVERDEAKILGRIRVMAAAVGDDWYYRFPVRTRGGGQDYIEGPSIKCANNVARMYGNCQVDTRVVDNGDSWIIYARFVDYETGFSYTRPFQQRKGQTSVKSSDGGRQLDIALQIGVSKAIRNVICNALETFTNFAYEEARKSMVDKIGAKLEAYRARVLERLEQYRIPKERVEAHFGRTASEWLAPDIARIISQIQAINDGMATLDDTWPPLDTSTPRPTREQYEQQSEPKPEPFSVASFNGEIVEHVTADAAAEAYRAALAEGEKQQGEAGLTAVWDNNQSLMQALDERGHPDLSRDLGLEYGKRRQEAAAAAKPAATPDKTDKAPADKTPADKTTAAPEKPARDEAFWSGNLVLVAATDKGFVELVEQRCREATDAVDVESLSDANGPRIDALGKADKAKVLGLMADARKALQKATQVGK